jgi:hypothetical protein
LTRDITNLLHGWHVPSVHASENAHNIDRSDTYGSLFFHVKDQLENFATRIQNLNINIILSQAFAHNIPRLVSIGKLEPINQAKFDLASNLGDQTKIPKVLSEFAPLCNKENPYAAIVMNTVDWILHEPTASCTERFQPSNAAQIMRDTAVALVTPSPNIKGESCSEFYFLGH